MGKFPKNPKKGDRIKREVRGRMVTFMATGKQGFGKWQIVANEPIDPETWAEAVKMERNADKPLKKRIKQIQKQSPKVSPEITRNKPIKKWTPEMGYVYRTDVQERAKKFQACGYQTKIEDQPNGDWLLYYKDKPQKKPKKKGILAKLRKLFS